MSFKRVLLLSFFTLAGIYLAYCAAQISSEVIALKQINNIRRSYNLTVRVRGKVGGGTGIIVKPGPNNLTRVITNSHVCDMITEFPPDDIYSKMSLRESLLLPVKGIIVFSTREKAKIIRILKHADNPDLCLLEVNRKGYGDYAVVAKRPPLLFEEYYSIGYPLGYKLVRKGLYQGTIKKSNDLVRMRNPKRYTQLKEFKKEMDLLYEESLRIGDYLFDKYLSKDIMPPEDLKEEKRLKEIYIRVEKIMAETESLMKGRMTRQSIFTIFSSPGSSGSGIWNKEGEIVAIVFAIKDALDISYAIPQKEIKDFLDPRQTW